MKYTSIRKNGKALVLVFALGLSAFVCIALAVLGVWLRGLLEAAALLIGVAMIQIWQRHLITYYEYIIDPADEVTVRNRLTVVQVVGKRRTSLYTVPLSSLSAVTPYRKMRKVEREYGKIGKKMSFCTDISPKESYLLVFESEGVLTLLRLQCGAEFASALEERSGF